MLESLSQYWAVISTWNLLEIAAAALVVSTVLERIFNVEFVGRRIFRLLGRILKFFFNWLLMPVKPQIEQVKKLVSIGQIVDEKLALLMEHGVEREQQRNEQFVALDKSLGRIEKEITLNGGGSINDAVTRLVKHDSEKWNILTGLLDMSRLMNLRLDIMDDADRRMNFRLSAELGCTRISPSFLRFFGYTETDMIGNDWEFCISERSRSDVAFKWQRSQAKRVPYRNEQYIIDSDGKEYLCLVRGYPIFFDAEFDGFYGTVEVIENKDQA